MGTQYAELPPCQATLISCFLTFQTHRATHGQKYIALLLNAENVQSDSEAVLNLVLNIVRSIFINVVRTLSILCHL